GDIILSFVMVVAVFAAIFKVIPDVDISWTDVWVGALVTAVLFSVGKAVISSYLGHSGIGSAYGAAGSLLVILAWVYYTSQVLFFGAEFTKAYVEKQNVAIHPVSGAKVKTKEAQARMHQL